MDTYIHTHIHAYIHTYMHTYIHTRIRTYIHTYIDKWKPMDRTVRTITYVTSHDVGVASMKLRVGLRKAIVNGGD